LILKASLDEPLEPAVWRVVAMLPSEPQKLQGLPVVATELEPMKVKVRKK